MEHIFRLAPRTLFLRLSLKQLLAKTYPDYSWDQNRFSETKVLKASQRILLALIKEIFPNSGSVRLLFSS